MIKLEYDVIIKIKAEDWENATKIISGLDHWFLPSDLEIKLLNVMIKKSEGGKNGS